MLHTLSQVTQKCLRKHLIALIETRTRNLVIQALRSLNNKLRVIANFVEYLTFYFEIKNILKVPRKILKKKKSRKKYMFFSEI